MPSRFSGGRSCLLACEQAVRSRAGARRTARSRSRAGGCSASSGRTAPGRRRRCARSSGSSSSTPARCSGTGGRSGWPSGCGSATCRRSAASTRGCRSASSSSTSAACTGWTTARRAPPAARWLERLGLADRAGAKVEELSHGNQQRAQLAAALLHEPELLVLDEPFAGLDPVAVHTLAEVLRGEAARGAAVLFSSHQLELVEDICEEVAIIDHGRIVATGDVDALDAALAAAADRAPARGRAAAVAAGRRRRRAGRAPQRRPAAAGRPRRRSGAGARRGGAVGARRRVQLRAAVARRALPGAGGADERPARDHARRAARDPRALRSKVFLVSTLVMLLLVGGSTALQGALSKKPTYRRRGDGAGAARAPRRAPTRREAVRRREGAAAGRRLARRRTARRSRPKQVDALLLLRDDRLVFRASVDAKAPRSRTRRCARSASHLPPAPELTTATLDPPDEETTDAEILVAIARRRCSCSTSLAIYGQWVVTGVVEEKNNRVVELILSTVRPRHLLAGKVIGIGLLGLAQLALDRRAHRRPPRRGSLRRSSSARRQRRARHPVVRARVRALRRRLRRRRRTRLATAERRTGRPARHLHAARRRTSPATSHSAPTRTACSRNVLTVFPLTAPLVLPARSALVGVPLWEHALAVVLVLGSIYALVRFAGRVYAHGLLRSGPRLGARDAWRLTHML